MASPQPSPATVDRPEVTITAVDRSKGSIRGSDAPGVPLLVLAATKTATYTAARAIAPRGLTATSVIAVGAVLTAAGAGVDMTIGRGPALALTLSFLVACAGMAVCMPLRLVATAVIAAPLLFAGAISAIAYVAGDAQGTRQLALEVATSLALSAPVLFAGTGLTVIVAIARFIGHVSRRSR